jgi:amino-acid N-acetyltransferase
MTASIVIEAATAADLHHVLDLLKQSGLPLEGLAEHVATTLVARHSGRIVGSAALETYAEGVLLRSVAVAPDVQGRGTGRMLSEAAIDRAEQLGAPAIFLLTTTAERYFARLGFQPVDRSAVPQSVKA